MDDHLNSMISRRKCGMCLNLIVLIKTLPTVTLTLTYCNLYSSNAEHNSELKGHSGT